MQIIFKYPWQEGVIRQLELPKGAKLLTIQVQRGHPMMWFEQEDESVDLEQRTFIMRVTGTAYNKPTNEVYVATIQLDEGAFVGHIFELT